MAVMSLEVPYIMAPVIARSYLKEGIFFPSYRRRSKSAAAAAAGVEKRSRGPLWMDPGRISS